MQRNFRPLTIALAAALAFSLTACGGGGGGSDAGTPTNPTTPVTPPADVISSSGTIQVTAPAASYAAGSVAADAYSALNTFRTKAGAGVLVESTLINTAAQAHADYLHVNPADGHVEVAGKTGFYADTVSARLTKAGFAFSTNTEVIGGTGASMKGSDCISGLLTAVYHGAAILSPNTTTGVGISTDGLGVPLCVVNFATASTDKYGQVPAAGSVVTYPFNGQTGVIETFYVANEVPRLPVALFPNATAGHPIYVSLRNADWVNYNAAGTLNAVVTSFTLTDAGGNVVPATVIAASQIKGATGGPVVNTDSTLPEGFVILIPTSPLTKNAAYKAVLTATLKTGGNVVTGGTNFVTNP